MFEQFPYTNFHELNLDWIIQKLKEAYSPENPPDNVVLSVNGATGDVVLYQDAVVRFPNTDEGTWNIHRMANGISSGIQFLPGKAQRIDGTNRYDIYDSANPPAYPVTSVNGETGAVTITVPVQSVNGETGAVVLYRNAITKLPDVTEASWNIYRVCNGTQRGIQFSADKAERIEDTNRYEIYDAGNPPPYPVTSVNGETGAVTIPDVVTDLDAEILSIDTASEENYWGFVRKVSTGTASIYLDTSNNTIKAYISYISADDQTNVTLPLLTSADIPSSSGVVSINGKTGAVTLYGSEIYTDSNSQRTVSQELSANANAIAAETTRAGNAENTLTTNLNAEITRAGNAESTITTNLNAEITRAGAEEEKLQNAIAIIVDGDSAGQAVPVGGYAYIKNNTHGLDDGLYINSGSSAFPTTGGTADGTTFTAVSDGGLNSLNSKITNKTNWSRIANITTTANALYDQTIPVTVPDDVTEIMLTLQRASNGRTFATTVIPWNQFNGGAIYAGGSYTLYSGTYGDLVNLENNRFINAAAIFVSNSSIEIAINANNEPIQARIFVR